ncbi:beta strand repeat-containing protein [Deinococcus aquaticus]|uniref:beta strand repeat-containing protein n=1 Tax=Deinococcus aquaticus TaxID=328692 RepID=UPI003F44E6F7
MFNPRSLLLTAALSACSALAAGTPVNTKITNTATLTYKDALNAPRDVKSNVVTVTVRQVYALTITPNSDEDDLTIPAARSYATYAGARRLVPYTLTNNSNGDDSFDLSVTQSVTDGYDVTTRLFLDANQDGVADTPGTPISGPVPLKSGKATDILVEATIPTGTADSLKSIFALVGTSVGNNTVTDTNNYAKLTVSAIGQLNVTHTADRSTANPGETVTFTLNATVPTGNPVGAVTGVVQVDGTPRTGVIVRDLLPTLEFGSVSAFSASDGTTSLTGTPVYSTDGGATWTATAPSSGVNAVALLVAGSGAFLPAGSTLSMTFTATVPATALAATTQTATASATFDANLDGDGADTTETTPDATAQVTVNTVYRGALGPNGFPGAAATGDYTLRGVTISRSGDAQTTTTPIVAGTGVTFRQTLRNTGNATNDFTLAVSGAPIGWTCTVVSIDGTDTLGAAITGPVTLAVNATVDFAVTCSVPFSAAGQTNVALTVTATPAGGGAADTTTSTVAVVSAAGLPVLGNGDGDTVTAPTTTAVTVAANPGQTAVFPLELKNGGPVDEAFTLSGGPTGTLYYIDVNGDGLLDAGDTLVTTTAALTPGSTLQLLAVVPVSAGTPAGDTSVTFTATSTTDTNRVASVTDTLQVSAVTSGTFTPDGALSTISGGEVVYAHTLENTSNDAVNYAVSAFTSAQSSVFTYTYSTTLNGTYTSTLGGTVARGGTQSVFVKVAVASGLAETFTTSEAAAIQVTITAQKAPASAVTLSATDTTTVQSVTGAVVKTAYLCSDAACTTSTLLNDNDPVSPGDYLRYTLQVRNTGTSTLYGAILNDQLPIDKPPVGTAAQIVTSYHKLSASNAKVLFSVNGGMTWTSSTTSPTGLFGASGSFMAALDSDVNGVSDGVITDADVLPAGASFTVDFIVKVN